MLDAAARDGLGPAKLVAQIVRRRGEVALYLMGAADCGPLRIGTARDIDEPLAQAAKYNHAELRLWLVMWCAGPESASALKALALAEAKRRRLVIRDSWLNVSAAAAERMLLAIAEGSRIRFLTEAERADEIRREVEREIGA